MTSSRMGKLRCVCVISILVSFTLLLRADTDRTVVREDDSCHNIMPSLNYVNRQDATIASPQDARAVLDALIKAAADPDTGALPMHSGDQSLNCQKSNSLHSTNPNLDADDFYCLIHVLLWSDPSSADAKPANVNKQNWYVYHAGKKWRLEDFQQRARLFGSKNVWLMFVHLNARPNYPYEIRYDIDAQDLTPTPLSNALALVGIVAGTQKEGGEKPQDFWGMYPVTIVHLPDQIAVQPGIVAPTTQSTSNPVYQKIGTAPTNFVNEGRYHFDFGVAVPVKGIKQTTVNTTNGTITPTTTSTQNAFAVLDLYPIKTDVRNATFSYCPYLVFGVATASQPLHKLLFAAGWGPAFTQLYLGALLVKQSNATPGSPSVSSQSYKPQFSIGINLSVKGFKTLMKKTS